MQTDDAAISRPWRPSLRRLLGLLAVVSLAAACVSDGQLEGAVVPTSTGDDAPQTVTAGPLAPPERVAVDCPPIDPAVELAPGVDPTLGVTCGLVILPEDRTDPAGPVVEVAWTRLRAQPPPDTVARDTPLVVLADGPGESATAEVATWLDSSIRLDRDVLLVDDRGAGRSFPSLDCGLPPAPGALPPDLVEDCRRDLVATGIDLRAYSTASIAQDVIGVASALSIDRYHVLGVGHGAKVALTMVEARAPGLESVVLDSPVPRDVDPYAERPAQAQAVLNRLFDECAQAPTCDQVFGDLRSRVERTVGQLSLPPSDPDGEPSVTGQDLVRATLAAMRGAGGPATVPAALQLANDGQAEEALTVLQAAAVAGATVPSSAFSEGLLLSSDCTDEVPFGPAEVDSAGLSAIGLAVAADVQEVLSACDLWPVAPAVAEPRPVTSTLPTLVLTGEFDPFSSAAWGAAIASRIDGAHIVQVDGAGHRVHDVDNCTTAIVAEFLRRPRRTPNDACATDRVVDFVLP